ncbi:MAG: isoprenylcysteine carboxylmethyltransferase family protein [Chloroflexota bacterium]
MIETVIRWLGGLLAYAALGIVLYGVWRGTKQQAGRTVGLSGGWLRSWWFYLACTVVYFGLAYLGWKPLPLAFSPPMRVAALVVGSLLYFPGLLFLLWARLTLGKNYFVSTGFGAQLFKDHQLVTSGPFAIVRHPMYAGLILAALGSLLIYFTWTTVYFACFAPLMFFRARREETALLQEFGEEWKDYCKRVPSFVPRLRREQ